MLSEEQIRDALHADRVVPVGVANPHGPIGLEQLAEAVAHATGGTPLAATVDRVQRPVTLPLDTWRKLDSLARAASRAGSRRLTASDVVVALIERSVAGAT